MISKHVSLLAVRHYDCDAYGHLNNVSYLRFVREAILQAVRRDVFPEAASRWQTSRLDIAYAQQVLYGQEVEVSLSAVLGAGVMRGAFQCQLLGSPGVVASGGWEAAEPGRSADDLENLEKASAHFAWSPGPIGSLPAPPPGVFSVRRCLTWQDLDFSGRVSDIALLTFTEACGYGVVEAYGWPLARMGAEGFAIIVRRHRACFLLPPVQGDELEISTYASEVQAASAWRHYLVKRLPDGALMARVDTLGVWISLATGRPIRIPAGFRADFAPNLVD